MGIADPELARPRRVVLRRGAERLRLSPWRGSDRVVLMSPLPDAAPPSPALVARALERVSSDGYREAVTGALASRETLAFLQNGFDVREHLHLLAHDLHRVAPPARPHRLRRARKADHPAVLAVDNAAFDEFWQLDSAGLDDALRATPGVRFRVNAAGDVRGYSIWGRAGSRGYLQRLAVHPDHQGDGLGWALISDGLSWLRRRNVVEALVNTQIINDHAVAVYQAAGFVLEPHGLSVLSRRLDGAD